MRSNVRKVSSPKADRGKPHCKGDSDAILGFLGLKSKHGRGEGGKASLRECRGHLKGMSRGGRNFVDIK